MVTCNIGSTLISYCQENLTKCRKVTWDGLTSHLEEKYNTLTHFMLVKVVLLLLSLCEDHLALCQFPFTCQILNLGFTFQAVFHAVFISRDVTQ